jgi:hypothetical protein
MTKKFIKGNWIVLTTITALFLINCSPFDQDPNQITNVNTTDILEADAEATGYVLPDVPVQGVDTFSIETNAGTINTQALNITTDKYSSEYAQSQLRKVTISPKQTVASGVSAMETSGNTSSGVVVYTAQINSTINGTVTVQVWRNGEYSPEINASSYLSGDIVLSPGGNYILLVVLIDGVEYGRSNMLYVNSSVTASLYRFELSWDNSGDMDLHVDDGTGNHVYYGYSYLSNTDYEIELDVDNVYGYGPENIRVYRAPIGSELSVYVLPYSISNNINATVKVYKDEILQNEYPLVFNATSSCGCSLVGDTAAQLVGTFAVN